MKLVELIDEMLGALEIGTNMKIMMRMLEANIRNANICKIDESLTRIKCESEIANHNSHDRRSLFPIIGLSISFVISQTVFDGPGNENVEMFLEKCPVLVPILATQI